MKRAGILFVLAGLGACPAPAGASDCQVTMAQYEQLRIGMSEAQVVAILGCDGIGLESTDGEILVLLWDGTQRALDPPSLSCPTAASFPRGCEFRGTGLGAVFEDGKLVQKTQSGLK